jgi:PAS domain S-box-containing protein
MSLLESEERFQTMADAAPVLMWMSGEDKLCTFFNKAWLEFTGRTAEQEFGDGWVEGVHPDDLAKTVATYRAAFDARKPFAIQYRLQRHDGEYRSIADHGVPRYGPRGNFRGYVGTCVDITDLLKKETALREIEERTALAAEAAQLGVWELDKVTNQLWVSDKMRELFQFDGEGEVTYAMLQERVHPEDRPVRESAIRRAIETKAGYELEYRLLLPDGAQRWIGGRARCIDHGDGNPLRLIGVAIDVTERKKAEEAARHQREQINLLSRVSLLGEMTASLAHELNQPLAAIITNANAGMRFIDRGGEQDLTTLHEILADVVEDGRRAHGIIQNVRNTVKKGDPSGTQINLNELIAKVVYVVRPDAVACSCEVETSLSEDLPLIEGDPIQIQQVLVNLVSNAFDAMGHTPLSRRKLQIGTASDDGKVHVSFRDHGTGIPPDVRERLFDQFFTTKAQGLGMGLAIVRSIVEAHGGEIEAENVPDGGARFSFTLPVIKR